MSALTGGFGATVVMAIAWLITHLPWLHMPEQTAIPCVLVAWLGAFVCFAGTLPRSRSVRLGLSAGLVSGLSGLLFFGTTLASGGSTPESVGQMVPGAPLRAIGFVLLGVGLGLIGGVIGGLIARPGAVMRDAPHWLARFALVTSAAVVPLVFIGGLVTSTDSGMAVPDWPRTYGANMFLYPLGSHVAEEMAKASAAGKTYEQVFVEHSHRLFGAFLGLAAIVLLISTVAIDRRRWVKVLAWIAFLLVLAQGLLGGWRVLEDSRLGAMVHGVLAQLTFGVVVGLAVVLSDAFRAATPETLPIDPRLARRAKALTTGTLHSLILQLLLGAAYRHFRHIHILWTHILVALVVVIIAMIAGFTLTSEPLRRSSAGRVVRAIGIALAGFAIFQFMLGWLAFLVAGRDLKAQSIQDALVRTIHQADGAILLAIAVAAFVWGRKLWRCRVQGP
ncbi:MAG TPA: COX15/CtaA family protein [Phycisphaerales bacterium]|nr:COX15/CtaA family protein [Phycisphaerales bacterium]